MSKILRKTEAAIKGYLTPGALFEELGLRYNALAVDMETAALVAYATEKNIIFLCLILSKRTVYFI